jgi:hypothetical protein
MNEDYVKGIVTAIVAIIFVPLIAIATVFYDSLFIKLIYNMFMPELYDFPVLTFGKAIAISLVINIMFFPSSKSFYKDHENESKKQLAYFFLRPVILFLFALFVKKFFI